MRAADFRDESGSGLQVVPEGAGGLKFQSCSQATFAAFLSGLNEGDLYPFNRLLREWLRNVAGDDDGAGANGLTDFQAAQEQVPGFSPPLTLARQDSSLKAGHRRGDAKLRQP